VEAAALRLGGGVKRLSGLFRGLEVHDYASIVDRNRIGLGIAIATFVVGLAAVPAGIPLATPILVIAALLIAAATMAPAVPGLKELPLVGLRRAAFNVDFDPADPACVQDRSDHPQRDLQLRLRVTNTGAVPLSEVRLRLKNRHDTFSRIRYDDAPPYERSNAGVALPAGSSEYFDIAFCHLDQPQMVLQYANAYLIQEQLLQVTPKTATTPITTTVEARREDSNERLPVVRHYWLVVPDGPGISLSPADA
jgi:hypothetical protein